jgi:hypothetical protein
VQQGGARAHRGARLHYAWRCRAPSALGRGPALQWWLEQLAAPPRGARCSSATPAATAIERAAGAAAPRLPGRFAPSPTGPLHAGSLVAALASWLDARAHGGRWLVRIEDVDTPRCVPGADRLILGQLPPAACTRRAAAVAVARGAPTPRRWTRCAPPGWPTPAAARASDIDAALAAQGQPHRRTASASTPAPAATACTASRRAPAAAHAPADGRHEVIDWHDRRLGRSSRTWREVGDFVLRRADGLWAYQLAVVVDDAAQGITTWCAARTWPTTRRARSCCSGAGPAHAGLPAHAAGAGGRRPQAQQAERRRGRWTWPTRWPRCSRRPGAGPAGRPARRPRLAGRRPVPPGWRNRRRWHDAPPIPDLPDPRKDDA